MSCLSRMSFYMPKKMQEFMAMQEAVFSRRP